MAEAHTTMLPFLMGYGWNFNIDLAAVFAGTVKYLPTIGTR